MMQFRGYGKTICPGTAQGPWLLLDSPLSLWGGYDLERGMIMDATHPQAGLKLAGCVVAMPFGRGSSSSSSALLECARIGSAPAAFVLQGADPILATGSIVAEKQYGISIPIVVLPSYLWVNLPNRGSAFLAALSDQAQVNIDDGITV